MESLQVERRGAAAWIWLNRPQRLNALDYDLIAALHDTFRQLSSDDTVRVIVLAGHGRAFCAGFDIGWMATRTPEMVRSDRAQLRTVFDTIEACPQPLISVVHGDALGGGLILTLVSDIVLASDAARFGAPEVKIGIFPSLELVPRLERVVGLRAAKHMTLTGDAVDAAAALHMGLVTSISPNETLIDDAHALAEQLAALPPCPVQTVKAAFAAHRLPGYVDWETESAVTCWSAPERTAAMQAFLDRRKSS